jgi:hypothetical protein
MASDSIWSRIKLGFFLIAILSVVIFVYRKILKISKTVKEKKVSIDTSVRDDEPDRGTQLLKKKENKTYYFADLFDKKITNLFTIITAIAVLLSLFPFFSNFLIGPDWLNAILSTELGFWVLTLLLIGFNAGLIFMLSLLISMCEILFSKISGSKCSHQEKIIFLVLISIGLISIFTSILFLGFIWFVKFDFAIFYIISIITIVVGGIGLVIIYYLIPSFLSKRAAIIIAIIMAGLVIWIFGPIPFNSFTEITHYYSDKTIVVKIDGNITNQNNITPVILHLNRTLDAYTTKNLSFDVYYIQCHWSTNYGYFSTTTSNNSLVKRQSQELIIPGCDLKENVFWTYDIGDYGKNKPPLFIGMTLEDRNKKENNLLGDAHKIINWTNSDSLNIENGSFTSS